MNHNEYYAQALDVIAVSINSLHCSGRTIVAMLQYIDHNTAQAVAIERNMTATWLDKLGDDEMWADIATRYHLAAEAVRNGEHVKP